MIVNDINCVTVFTMPAEKTQDCRLQSLLQPHEYSATEHKLSCSTSYLRHSSSNWFHHQTGTDWSVVHKLQVFFWLQIQIVSTQQTAHMTAIRTRTANGSIRPLDVLFCFLVSNICFSLHPSLTESVLTRTPPATRTQLGPSPWAWLTLPAFCTLPLVLEDLILRTA